MPQTIWSAVYFVFTEKKYNIVGIVCLMQLKIHFLQNNNKIDSSHSIQFAQNIRNRQKEMTSYLHYSGQECGKVIHITCPKNGTKMSYTLSYELYPQKSG